MKDISLSLFDFSASYLRESSLNDILMPAKTVESDSLNASKSLEMQMMVYFYINEVNWSLTGVNKNNLFSQYLALACNIRNCSQSGNTII